MSVQPFAPLYKGAQRRATGPIAGASIVALANGRAVVSVPPIHTRPDRLGVHFPREMFPRNQSMFVQARAEVQPHLRARAEAGAFAAEPTAASGSPPRIIQRPT